MQFNRSIFFIFLFGVLVIGFACEKGIPTLSDSEISEFIAPLPENVTFPQNNPYSLAQEELGKMLFWDPVLSGNKDVACVTCHHPALGYADAIPFSQGVGGVGLGTNRTGGTLTKRNAPTVINAAFNGILLDGSYTPQSSPMFWDNRAQSLEGQALLPILSKEEMRGTSIPEAHIVDTIIERLNQIPEYKELFLAAYGSDEVNQERILQAIATFERGIIANNSRFDQYMRGDQQAMSENEVQGMNAFVQVGCADCHGGPMFSDYKLHTIGVPDNTAVPDEGATGAFDFRTPTLRNLSITSPYMHNGIHQTLEEVMEFYLEVAEGENEELNEHISPSQLDVEMQDLQMDDEHVDAIISFLKTLDDNSFDQSIPSAVPSGLPVGGNIQ